MKFEVRSAKVMEGDDRGHRTRPNSLGVLCALYVGRREREKDLFQSSS